MSGLPAPSSGAAQKQAPSVIFGGFVAAGSTISTLRTTTKQHNNSLTVFWVDL